jgi:natural product precursor
MKRLGKLKLNALNEQDLAEKQMNALRGGDNCMCSCYWEGRGGSSSMSNMSANFDLSTYSTHGCNQYWAYSMEYEILPDSTTCRASWY